MLTCVPYAEARRQQLACLAAATPRLAEAVSRLAGEGVLDGPGVDFVGIGASFAAACTPVWQLRARGVDAARLAAGDHPLPLPETGRRLVLVSASGASKETLALAEACGPERLLSVVNVAGSALAGVSQRQLWLGGLPDSYASTVGFTATVIALNLLAEAWSGGTIQTVNWQQALITLAGFDRRLDTLIAPAADLVAEAPWVDVVSHPMTLGSAEETALLLREVAATSASAWSTRQYLHGPRESVGRGIHILLGGEGEANLARSLAAHGHGVILVSPVAPAADGIVHLPVPSLAPGPTAVAQTLVAQTLVQRLAALKGLVIEDFVFASDETKVVAVDPGLRLPQ
jgi:glucosamine--fructose-6-phosphate aminotransferase (isomerizing)